MAIPYQCIKRCGSFLLAARGSSIDSFRPEDGSLLSTWECPSAKSPTISNQLNGSLDSPVGLETQNYESSIAAVPESSPPAKRRKLSTADEDAQKPAEKNAAEEEQKTTKKKNKRSDAVLTGLETPAVTALAATKDGRHVVVVTGEDKSIRVFETTANGGGKHCIKQLSQRSVAFFNIDVDSC